MIDIRPDPKHPRGGFAQITVAGVPQSDSALEIAVFNAYQQKWLGPSGWQGNRETFPVRAQTWTGDQLRVIVGPDVVNQIDDDTPLKIVLGGQEWDTYWPDDINHGPDEALEGGISGAAAAAAPAAPKVVTTLSKASPPPAAPVAPPAPEPEPEGAPETPPEASDAETKGGSKLPLILGGLVLLAALAAAIWFFVLAEDAPAPVPAPVPVPVPAPGGAQPDPCGAAELGGLAAQGFAALATQLRSCGGAVSADDALGFVERAAQGGDGDALALFGALYDSSVTDPEIEDQIGLTFSDQPAVAASYYARARDAGSAEGATRLNAICLRLALDSSTLAQSAREDYCQ